MKKFEFKKDKYRKARGGTARLLSINCTTCNATILLYQKDGPGPLKRAYMDRIFSPQQLVGLEAATDISKIKNLACPKCKTIIGMSYIYEKEKRPAFLLRPGFFTKKIIKNNLFVCIKNQKH